MNEEPKHECQNCEWIGTESEMENVYPNIPDLWERMDPGEDCPSGECPKCGALCHEAEVQTKD